MLCSILEKNYIFLLLLLVGRNGSGKSNFFYGKLFKINFKIIH